MNRKNTFVISMGGSLIVPGNDIDVKFLKKFKNLIHKEVKKGKKFIIVCGGGKTARKYQEALKKVGDKIKKEDIDWLGIEATHLNAMLVNLVFSGKNKSKIIKSSSKEKIFKEEILVSGGDEVLIAGGFKPGCSTDYISVLLADKFKTRNVLNLTNIDFVYDKNPKKFKTAKPLKEISWKDFRKLLPKKWVPGSNVPFDPVASKKAEEKEMEVSIINGKKLKQVENYLNNKKFIGTIIGKKN